MRDESSDADNRVVDVLRKFVDDRLAHLYVGLADESVGGREPAEVGHRLQAPHADARLHACRHRFIITIFNADCLDPNQRRLSLTAPWSELDLALQRAVLGPGPERQSRARPTLP